MRRSRAQIRILRLTAGVLALVTAGFGVAASFHHHDPPAQRRTALAAEGESPSLARVHDCLACRLSQGVATLTAAAGLPGQAPVLPGPVRVSDVTVTSRAGLTPSSPRAPPVPSLIRL